MADLGAAVGVSGPALYRHFASKDAMLAEMLIAISEELLREGRIRAAADSPVDAVRSLVRWHIDVALHNRPLIVLQDRDWALLSTRARERVRTLQREYVEVWVDALLAANPSLSRSRGRAMAHAVFGLLNSTPHSSHLPDPDMAVLLESMAGSCLGLPLSRPVETGPG